MEHIVKYGISPGDIIKDVDIYNYRQKCRAMLTTKLEAPKLPVMVNGLLLQYYQNSIVLQM